MKDFADIPNASGTFPDVVSVDCSGPGETDGTAHTSDLINDGIFAPLQGLLADRGWTPNDITDNVTDGQILEAIRQLVAEKSTWCANWESKIADASYTGDFTAVAFGDHYTVIVGQSGEIQHSYDNNSWTSNTQGSSNFLGVAYGNGYWVAVGVSGTLYYTTDPTGSWTSNTQGSSDLHDVMYDSTTGYWIAIGVSGTLYYKSSTPVGSWTPNTQGSNTLLSIIRAGSYLVMCGVGDDVYYTTDPTTATWNTKTLDLSAYGAFGLAYGNNRIIMATYSDGLVWCGDDPSGTWTEVDPDGGGYWTDICFAAGIFIACGEPVTPTWDQGLITSIDRGLSWVHHIRPDQDAMNGIADCNNQLVCVGENGTINVSLRRAA